MPSEISYDHIKTKKITLSGMRDGVCMIRDNQIISERSSISSETLDAIPISSIDTSHLYTRFIIESTTSSICEIPLMKGISYHITCISLSETGDSVIRLESEWMVRYHHQSSQIDTIYLSRYIMGSPTSSDIHLSLSDNGVILTTQEGIHWVSKISVMRSSSFILL